MHSFQINIDTHGNVQYENTIANRYSSLCLGTQLKLIHEVNLWTFGHNKLQMRSNLIKVTDLFNL